MYAVKNFNFVPDAIKGIVSNLKVNFETKEKSHQALIFFVTSSCSNKPVENINFVYIIQLKTLCIVLKEFTAAFAGVWQNITF